MLTCLISLVSAQQLNLADPAAVAKFSQGVTQQAMQYYLEKPGADGEGAVTPNPSGDASGIQWYESGIYWGAILDQARLFKSNTNTAQAGTALGLASNGNVGSFLGANSLLAATMQGKWNDDILWWGLAAMSGAEMFGKTATMPDGLTYLQVAINTYKEAWQQWDTTQCKGGIFWSRDRSAGNAKRGYKSSITNSQHIMLGARLFIMTGDASYITNARATYAWLKQGLVSKSWKVYDGIDGGQGCGMNINEHSYNSGVLVGALGWLFKATNDASYLADASALVKASISEFTRNGIIADPCEPKCKPNEVQAKGTMIRGLGYFAALTTSQADKTIVRNLLGTSLKAMAATCDSQQNCGTYWVDGTKGSNFHSQTNAVELVNAYNAALAGAISGTLAAPKAAPAPNAQATASGSKPHSMAFVALSAVMTLTLAL